jgi:hypothetical protein
MFLSTNYDSEIRDLCLDLICDQWEEGRKNIQFVNQQLSSGIGEICVRKFYDPIKRQCVEMEGLPYMEDEK